MINNLVNFLQHVNYTKDGQSCVDVVNVQQQGDTSLDDIANSQVIFQMSNTSCGGRITGFIVSLSQEQNGSEYPSIQVWSPNKSSGVFMDIRRFVLAEDDINEAGDYYFANISLEEIIYIVPQGSFIGCYQPPNPRYTIWSVNTTGYNFYTSKENSQNPVKSFNVTSASDLFTMVNDSQPLIQIVFGKIIYSS